jgi:hypothetical protein
MAAAQVNVRYLGAGSIGRRNSGETIARSLGNPIGGRAGRKIEPLILPKRTGSNAKSLSVRPGLGSFPMHTDSAHLPQPPRFVVLVCDSPGKVAIQLAQPLALK